MAVTRTAGKRLEVIAWAYLLHHAGRITAEQLARCLSEMRASIRHTPPPV